ncbi:LRR receptor-like serine/threonine-protein kinase ERL1, partial [Mucuna pruriens]
LALFALRKRVALLKIKKDIKDPANCLSSCVGKDCCNWIGIECDNQTGHVLKLHLGSKQICTTTTNKFTWFPLGGEINPSLTDLKHDFNNFEGIPIPKFIGSLSMLRYLDLSFAKFAGMIPTHLGNLSSLNYLDISESSLWVRDVSWLSALSLLQYLHMNSINITSTSHELFQAVSMIPSLNLSSCNLVTLPPSLPFENFTSLSVLDLSVNHFNSSIPSWLFNMSNLTDIDLSFSSLTGSLPVLRRGNLCKLQNLDLSNNDLTGDITQMLETFSSCTNQSLMFLNLNSNKLTGTLPHSLGLFNSLCDLDLSSNSLSGPIPASVGNLSNLGSLNLEGNMMNGKIPESIGQLTKLYALNLLHNNWEDTITNIHFHNLSNLVSFFVSSKTNPFTLNVTQDWNPP